MRCDDFAKIEAAMDELLALYGERRRLVETMRASMLVWRARQRRARMKILVLTVFSLGAFGTAGAAALLQVASPRHPVLDWWPVILAAAGVIAAFAVTRQRSSQIELALLKKVDREIFDLKFSALEKGLEMQFAAMTKALEELRTEVKANRQRATDHREAQ